MAIDDMKIDLQDKSNDSEVDDHPIIMPDLHDILKHLPDIIFCVDSRGIIHYINHSGFSIEKNLSENTLLYNLMPSNCTKQLKPAIQRAFETLQTQQIEYLSGINQWWSITIQPIEKSDSNLVLVIFSEITRFKKTEQLFQFMELAFKQLFIDITITNSKGRIIFTNIESEQNSIGHLPWIFQNDIETPNSKNEKIWRTIEQGEIWIDSKEIPDEFGQMHHMEVTVLPIQDVLRQITHFMIIQRDLTRIKSLQNTLHEQVEQLKVSLDQKEKNTEILNQVIDELAQAKDQVLQSTQTSDEFLASISHEIRSPLNNIINVVRLIQDTELQPAQEKYVNLLKSSAEGLHTLINNILDFSKLQAGKILIEKREFYLDQTLNDILQPQAIYVSEKGLELILDIHPGVPNCVIGDSARLRQILINLLHNAAKFTKTGEIILVVETESMQTDFVNLKFSVIDTGIGIPKEMHQSIFQAFIQDKTENLGKSEGIGLGLTITSRLVEMLDGKMWIESPLQNQPATGGPGSAFHFILPFDLPEIQDQQLQQIQEKYLSKPVLIVEHHESQRKIIEQALSAKGLRPIGVETGRAALAIMNQMIMQQSGFSLALIDATLKGMDAFKLAEQILQDSELADSVIMMLYPSKLKSDIERCADLGIQEYIIKPINSDDLIQRLCKKQLDAVPIVDRPEEDKIIQNQFFPQPVDNLSDVQILMIDDDEPTCQFIETYLSQRGWNIVSATDGETALDIFQKKRFDLVLMDVQIQGMNGLEITTALRDLERKQLKNPVPIIAVTARSMATDRQQCLEVGMTDYIAKPVKADDLIELIESYLQAQPVQTASQMNTAINVTKAINTFHGDNNALLSQIEVFLESFPEKLIQFNDCVEQKQSKSLEKKAKELKVNSGRIGANVIYRLADRLETIGWKSNLHEAPFVLDKLSEAYKELKIFVAESELRNSLKSNQQIYRILVIEDNLAYQEFLRNQLEAHGYEIYIAKDGLEGLELARSERPDLIILDLMLPQVNGHAVTHMLKLDRNCQHIPIIILTCRNINEDAELAKKGGANSFMLKSAPIDQLLSEIKRLVNEKPHE